MQKGRYITGPEALQNIKEEVQRQFEHSMRLEEEKTAWEHHGWFLLRFWYTPKQYAIRIEGEFNGFSIRIERKDGAFISLKDLSDCSCAFTKEGIERAVAAIAQALRTEVAFFNVVNGKRYREIDGELRRVRR